MTNRSITDHLSLLGKLMEIHDENPFKTKAYSSAAFSIKQLSFELTSIDKDKIATVKGIGSSTAKSIIELIDTGHITLLDELIQKTPVGVIEMLSIKGLGPKKITTIWHELEIESLGELLYACNENKLTLFKGFGEKTQQSIKEAIEFYLAQSGKLLWVEAESITENITETLRKAFPSESTIVTGNFRRHIETLDQIEWVTNCSTDAIEIFFKQLEFATNVIDNNVVICTNPNNLKLCFYCSSPKEFISTLFNTSCSEVFLQKWKELYSNFETTEFETEEQLFIAASIPYIPPFLRETSEIITSSKSINLNTIIQPENIKGIIHSHSNWSDGKNTLEEMAEAAIKKGYEYLLITDHSKSAFYANGLKEDRIAAQQKQIEELNSKYTPFVIFKGIESDILSDGSLDYSEEVLSSFDMVIASVHSNLKMDEPKAMLRLLKAIESPYTSILGHMTGRLLLSRNGYPINHYTIIDACAANNVAIELNANPRRLDIDWRFIDYALQKNVLISINPDAHSIEGYNDCRYGVLVAQKAALPTAMNLSSFSLAEMNEFISIQHQKR